MSGWVIPLVVAAILLTGLFRGVSVYEVFLQGAREGLKVAFDIAPCLCAMLTATVMLSESGAMEALIGILGKPLSALGFPARTLPVFLLRPFSGSASLALLEKTLTLCGPDSLEGRIASTMVGSSETIFYTLSIYLGAAGIKKGRYALPAALLAWLAGGVAAVWCCRWF